MCADHRQGGIAIKGTFITFEGIDGCGKSTQIAFLKKYLESLGKGVVVVREPGGTQLSEQIRTILLDHRNRDLSERAEALLFSTARTQLVHEVILPALKEGAIVLCDRYAESTIAYQGYGRELPLEEIITIQAFATKGLRPDLIILLDLDVDVAAKRMEGLYADRMEREGSDFQERVRQGYLGMAKSAPDEWLVVNGNQTKKKIAAEIAAFVEQRIMKGL